MKDVGSQCKCSTILPFTSLYMIKNTYTPPGILGIGYGRFETKPMNIIILYSIDGVGDRDAVPYPYGSSTISTLGWPHCLDRAGVFLTSYSFYTPYKYIPKRALCHRGIQIFLPARRCSYGFPSTKVVMHPWRTNGEDDSKRSCP